MSKIEEMIAEMCPDGVEYKPLWSLTSWNKKFKDADKSKQPRVIKTNILLAKELEALTSETGTVKLLTTYPSNLYAEDTEEVQHLIRDDELVAIPWGGNPYIHYYNGRYITSDNRIAIVNDPNVLRTKFLYYFLLAHQKEVASCYRGSGIKHPHMALLIEMEIPVPPIEIQDAIVEILDTFTELEAELEAELEGRRRQYEYYRNLLLSFDKRERRFIEIFCQMHGIDFDCDRDLEWENLKEVFNIKGGYTPSKNNLGNWSSPDVPWYRMEDIRANGRILNESIQKCSQSAVKKSGLFPSNTVICATSATIGEHAIIQEEFLCNQRLHALITKEEYKNRILPMFVFYEAFLLDEYSKLHTNQGSFASVSLESFAHFQFPIPPLPVQQLIVDVLDKFSTLTEDITEGLPKELEMHRKQYEYYRNELLNFPRKEEGEK